MRRRGLTLSARKNARLGPLAWPGRFALLWPALSSSRRVWHRKRIHGAVAALIDATLEERMLLGVSSPRNLSAHQRFSCRWVQSPTRSLVIAAVAIAALVCKLDGYIPENGDENRSQNNQFRLHRCMCSEVD